jgi:hypothetical protein
MRKKYVHNRKLFANDGISLMKENNMFHISLMAPSTVFFGE